MEDNALILEFVAESLEHLEKIDVMLLRLEAEPDDENLVNDIFRSVHTIKGVSSMLSLTDITNLAHRMETLLNRYRNKEDRANAASIDILLKGRDLLRALIEDVNARVEAQMSIVMAQSDERLVAVLGSLDSLISGARSIAGFQVQPGSMTLEAALSGLADMASQWFSHAKNGTVTDVECKALMDGAIAFNEKITIPALDKVQSLGKVFLELAENLVAMRTDYPAPFEDMWNEQVELIRRLSPELPSIPPPSAIAATIEVKKEDLAAIKAPEKKAGDKTMRVDQKSLDVFMNLVGELVVSKNAISHTLKRFEVVDEQLAPAVRDLKRAAFAVSRISEEMQRSVMDMRMIPVEVVFQKFPRMVRDICGKNNKKVELVLKGEETRIDKGIAEAIADPLIHMVRNSVDHGVESPEERRGLGKNETGKVILSASHEGNNIVIRIIDDGKGIDPAKVLSKALERGLVSPEDAARLTKQEIIQFIYAPGFSLAEKITDISGRGVGMDVVNTNVAKIGGKIQISSEVGKGTDMRIELPLTTAIIDAMLVRAGRSIFAIPVHAVRESVRVKASEVGHMMKEMAISLRGQTVGVKFLENLMPSGSMDRRTENEADITVVILENGRETLGLAVDEILRMEEVVVKPMARCFEGLPGLAGASVLGDGMLILILDPVQVTELAMQDLK